MELLGSKLYQYLPLPQDTILSYRLVTLYPASDLSDTIQGSIRISSAKYSELEGPSFERFEALSYAWGDRTPTGAIRLLDNSYLPIAENLESFLRYRRQHDQPVTLWIDAICINQDDVKERNSQVQAMSKIYLLATRLSIWLGPPSDDSALAMSALHEFSYENAFSKLSSSPDQSTAIERLLGRAWWFRAWIVQEIALGGAGSKYQEITVRCGLERITWLQLAKACSRMHVNTLNMRQSFPAVQNVLKLDALASRRTDEINGTGESYPCRLLRHLSEHRNCLASNPRDKIYALIGLWFDSIVVGTNIDGLANNLTHRPAPACDYERSVEEVYTDYGSWVLESTRSLELLHYCQPHFSNPSVVRAVLPTWVPDWSQTLVQKRLPSKKTTERVSIPWWSLPIRDEHDGERVIKYRMDDQISRKKRAEEVLRPSRSSLHYIPEWVVDLMDPDGTKGYETMFKEFQNRPDVLFFFPDESDRALGVEKEDEWTAVSRTQDHNERKLQKQVLSQYLQDSSMLRMRYNSSGDTACHLNIREKELHVRGILCDIIQEIHDVFPEELEKNWMNSTLLMVQIGKCKHAIMKEGVEKNPYFSEHARLLAFWKTLFGGQQTQDEGKITSWLPPMPHNWQWNAPALTVFESSRLEYAEIGAMFDEFAKHLTNMNPDGGTYIHNGFDENLAKDDILLDARWTPLDRLKH